MWTLRRGARVSERVLQRYTAAQCWPLPFWLRCSVMISDCNASAASLGTHRQLARPALHCAAVLPGSDLLLTVSSSGCSSSSSSSSSSTPKPPPPPSLPPHRHNSAVVSEFSARSASGASSEDNRDNKDNDRRKRSMSWQRSGRRSFRFENRSSSSSSSSSSPTTAACF